MQKRITLPDQALFQLISYLVICLSILTGCTTLQQDQVTEDVQPSIIPVVDSNEMPRAIRKLMALADSQYREAQFEASLSSLERAIRIKPRQSETWSRMAQVYLQLGQYNKAIESARRSNSYIKDNSQLKAFNDQLIQQAESGDQH